MKTQVNFYSDSFPPVTGDTCNAPQRYGKKLAEWLAAKLPAYGLAVRDCYDEEGAFCCFITPDKETVRPMKRLFRATDTRATVEKLAAAVDALLRSHPRVSGIEWEAV